MLTNSKSLNSSRQPRLLIDYNNYFRQSKSGAIWSAIYFEVGDKFFPEERWTDMPVAFLSAWLTGLCEALKGGKPQKVYFFDGPVEIGLNSMGGGLAELLFIHREKIVLSATCLIRDQLEDASVVAGDLLTRCHLEGWTNNDTEELRELLESTCRTLKDLSTGRNI